MLNFICQKILSVNIMRLTEHLHHIFKATGGYFNLIFIVIISESLLYKHFTIFVQT
jgi:hypothetical protein